MRRTLAPSFSAIMRHPSYLVSKTQPGRWNGARARKPRAATSVARRSDMPITIRSRPEDRHHGLALAALAMAQTALESEPRSPRQRLHHAACLEEGRGSREGETGIAQGGARFLL